MNRRSFIQSMGLLTGSAFISLHTKAFNLSGETTEIKGRVTAKGRGIKNVVISDGFSVVQTDSKGYYSLNPHANAGSIFMSTPAGYEFKNDYNIVRQYQPIGEAKNFDFELSPLNKADDHHHFLIWADPQVRNKKDVKQMMETSVPDTQSLIQSIGPDQLVHGICVGDIAWDYLEYFEDYKKAVAQLGIPFFQALGNHDQDYRQGGDETSDKSFKKAFGPTYYSFNRGKAHYVVLDDVRYLGTEREYDGYITEAQLEWLAKDLASVPKNHLLIISLHIPVHNAVKNNEAFYKVLEGYKKVHIMSGHTHYNVNTITNDIYEHNHGTVCGAWWTGPICTDGTPRGYAHYEVNGTDLKWYYKPTGMDKDHQHHIYVDELTDQKRLLVNVWNHDPEWEVEYALDGKPMGTLSPISGYDPLSVKLYKGDKLPAGRAFPEPAQNSHMFLAHFKPEVKHVRVTVTDRFGRQYHQEQDV